MNSAGIKEVKNNRSRLLARVKVGKDVLITERGSPVARIVKKNQGDKAIGAALGPRVQKGMIAWPTGTLKKDRLWTLKASGKPTSEMVIEDRR